jgi:hypothetical protein
MNRAALLFSACAVLAGSIAAPALARPQYLMTFKAHYNTAQGKPVLNAANCSMCHIGMPMQAMWNPYGRALRAALAERNVQDRAKIVAAFQAAESQKANPNAQRTFGQRIQNNQLPVAPRRQPGQPGQPGQPARPAQPAQPGAGGDLQFAGEWEQAFNGDNMEGLTKVNAGNWTVQDGVLKYTGGGNGWLRTNRPYTNYTAILVWRYSQQNAANDSGFFLKAREGDNGSPWPRSPQLNMGPNQNYGNIGGFNTTRPRFDLIKASDWNTYQVTVRDGVATVAINGQLAWDFAEGDALRGPGYIGIQAEGAPFEIQQFWVRPLR